MPRAARGGSRAPALLLLRLWAARAPAGAATAASGPAPIVGSTFGSVECAEYGDCASCASAPGWLSHGCQWCEKDQRCYSELPWGNSCSASSTVRNSSSCPEPSYRQVNFSMQEAYDMLLHADASYYADPSALTPEGGQLPSSFKLMKNFHYTPGVWQDGFAYMGVDVSSARIVASFRGTDKWTQLTEELLHHSLVNQTWDPHPGALVNEYFVHATDLLWANMSQTLSDLMSAHPGFEVWLTGHSMGGAMAMIMALRMERLLERPPVVYTFGQPRTGNAAFGRLVDQRLLKLIRLVNAADPVPNVPRCDFSGSGTCLPTETGYYHAGTEVWFPEGEYENKVMCRFRECAGPEDFSCGESRIMHWNPLLHNGYFDIIPNGFCKNRANGTQEIIV